MDWLPPHTALIRIGEPAPDGGGHPTLLAVGPGGAEPAGSLREGRALAHDFLRHDQLLLCSELFTPELPLAADVRTAGGLLGRALAEAELLDPWLDQVRRSHAAGHPARTLLDVRPQPLRGLPWELVADPCDGAEPFCVSAGPGLTFARLDHPRAALAQGEPAPLRLPLRILVVLGETDPAIRADDEIGRIRTRLADPIGEWHVEVLHTPTSEELATALRDLTPHVLHFIGHRQRDDADRGVLTFHPPGREPWQITGANVHGLLAVHPPRLVVLNACDTAGPATEPLLAALLRGGVAAVIGMSGGIESGPAVRFAEAFHGALGQGEPVDHAVRAARHALLRADLDRADWARPVLAVRVHPDAVLERSADLRGAAETDDRFADERWNLRHAVDRVAERRRLFDGFAPTGPATPVTVVTGGPKIGKATLVRSALHTWYRNGALTIWVDLRVLGGTATWLDLVHAVVDRLREAAPGHKQLLLLEHRLARLHDHWTTDEQGPWLPLGTDRVWQETVPGNSVGLAPDRRHTALHHLADALHTLATEAGLVLALAGLGSLERLTLQQLLAPHLIEPLAARADGRARTVLIADDEEAALVPYPLRETARWIPLGPFASDVVEEAVRDYGRVRGLSEEHRGIWEAMMAPLTAIHGGLTPSSLGLTMRAFESELRVR
ncbi:CHAT domain-containing protein [Kitasatospora sp. NPDC093806]|uniref:CHAT domain-containing protein n=1 Tax=Kitasatospora sp. NPDC093806 TaxID=3155075 RepID=UPI003415CB5E